MASFGSTVVAYEEVDDKYETSGEVTRGRVWFAVAILGDAFADGSGTLATLTFNATSSGESTLDLHSIYPYAPDQIKLCTCGPEPIPHTVEDGYVTVSSDPCDSQDPPDPPSDPPTDPPADPVDNPPNPDVNRDGMINIRDLRIVALAYGTSIGDDGFDSSADLNHDDSINMSDLNLVAQNFGQRA
jgi:hypothetical protein